MVSLFSEVRGRLSVFWRLLVREPYDLFLYRCPDDPGRMRPLQARIEEIFIRDQKGLTPDIRRLIRGYGPFRLWRIRRWLKHAEAAVLVFRCEGRPVHFSVVALAPGKYGTYGNPFELHGKDWAMTGPCYTDPVARGRGLFPLALRRVPGLLAPLGYRRFYTCVATGNTPSIRGIEKSGYRRVGLWHAVRWFLLCLLSSPGAPAPSASRAGRAGDSSAAGLKDRSQAGSRPSTG